MFSPTPRQHRTSWPAGERALPPPMPQLRQLRPMEPRRELVPLQDGNWLFERKLHGLRVLAQFGDRRVELRTRRGTDCRAWFPEIAEALLEVPGGPFIVDGQVSVPSQSDAEAQRIVDSRLRHRRRPLGGRGVTFCVFDILLEFGFDLLQFPLRQRKQHLEALPLGDMPGLLLMQPLHLGKLPLRTVMGNHQLAGVVAKRLDSPYEPGCRSASWLVIERRPSPLPETA